MKYPFLAKLLFLTFLTTVAGVAHISAAESASADWPEYLGGKTRNLYSPLRQITRENVARLKVAWTYETGDTGEYQANNLIVKGVLYTPTPTRKVVALHAAPGREIWKWDPVTERSGKGSGRQRGLVYWQDSTGTDCRIFTGVGGYLFALNAKTGEVIRSFGENGSVDLASGLNTPGVIYQDTLILGGVGERCGRWMCGRVRSAGYFT